MGANSDGLLCFSASFLGGGVYGFAGPLFDFVGVVGRLVQVWDFFRFHCHITLVVT
jgi:hypothetical protein